MRTFIRSILQRFGYDIIKYRPNFKRGDLKRNKIEKELKWLQRYQFATIIDIGANAGQFSDKIRLLFPVAKIFAFEPLLDVFTQLKSNFSTDSNFEPINLGLGDQKTTMKLYKNEYSPSSSFLNLSSSHVENFAHARNAAPIEVKVDTLDQVMGGREFEFPLLVKIDVQGFEDRVIAGGKNILKKADIIICEISFVELFEGQALFADLHSLFLDMGFEFCGTIEQLFSPEDNRSLQADGIFIKRK